MLLIDPVSITVRDLDAVRPFYAAILGALGATLVYGHDDAVGFGERSRPGDDGHSYLSVLRSAGAIADPRRHWCLRAASERQVVAFHDAGLRHGGTDDGAPGLRDYHPGYFAAFLRDPEGNRLEAVFHRAGP
jgi:catechol 2,3-dioxygenase-like lactoylglutathione lyase family enzyme